MLPDIKFVYSGVYDSHWVEHSRLWGIDSNYPSVEDINARIKEAQKYWESNGKKILESISKQSGLKWKSESILVYVVGKSSPFSSPLTMPVYLNKGKDKTLETWINVLTHELIHNILVDNKWGSFTTLKTFLNGLGKISKMTYNHIPVHAIHSLVYKNIFSEKDLQVDIETTKSFPTTDYYDAWKVVLERGDKEIVSMLK